MHVCDFYPDCNKKSDEPCNSDYMIMEEKCFLAYNTEAELLARINYPFLSIFNCSFKKCPSGYFLCSYFKFCLAIELVCDGINHCLRNEDEAFCGRFTKKQHNFLKYLINILKINFIKNRRF